MQPPRTLRNYYERETNGPAQVQTLIDEFNNSNLGKFKLYISLPSNNSADYKMYIYQNKKLVGTIE
jgi:hypothetical protein